MILQFSFFGLLLPALASPLDPVPRRFVPYDNDNNRTFHEEGMLDYSTMLLREDLGLLMVGASGTVYALDLNDIKKKNDSEDLFFSEKAVEYDYKTMLVSRVARVCKGDRGGPSDFRDSWTSFVNARLECPVPGCKGTSIIQDTFRWCDPQQDWKSCLFFAVFTSQTCSAVCVYSVTDISRVFSEGTSLRRYSDGWMPNKDPLQVLQPGSCIDNAARKAGFNDSRELSANIVETTIHFPTMMEAVEPLGGKALMLKVGGEFTNIIIDQVQTADGDKHHMMFIGTKKGTIVKAVNYDGEMFIIEEVQVFKTSEPIKILKFSNVTRQIYAGSDSGVVQMSLSCCGRSLSCMDCVLARDPYCGWDHAAGKCSALFATQRELLQSVKEGNASLCPKTEPQTERKSLTTPGYLKLLCFLESKLAMMRWEKDNSPLVSSPHRMEQQDGLLILEVSKFDTGHYRCLSVMSSKDAEYKTTVAQYNVTIAEKTVESQPQQYDYAFLSQQIGLVLVVCSLYGLLIWNFCKGHIGFPCKNKPPRAVANHSCQACTNSKEQVDNNQENEDNVSTHV